MSWLVLCFTTLAAHPCVPSACGAAMCVTYTPTHPTPLVSLTSPPSTPDAVCSLSSYLRLFLLPFKKRIYKKKKKTKADIAAHLNPFTYFPPNINKGEEYFYVVVHHLHPPFNFPLSKKPSYSQSAAQDAALFHLLAMQR